MGLDMTYIAGGYKFSFHLSKGDIEILEFFRKKNFEKEIEVIVGVSEFGKESSVKRKLLLESINQFLGTVKGNRKLLPYMYILKAEIPRGSRMYSKGGEFVGLRVNSQVYSIEGGLDKCVLTKRQQINAGKWRDCEPKDVRDLKTIKTDEDSFFGDIKIYKRRKPTKLIKNLERLSSFLEGADESTIVKVLG